MRFSEAWLREHVNPPVPTARLVEQLTMAGLEVDSVEPAAPEFDHVIVAEVCAVEPHPNADKLRVCRVLTDGETLQVVCGAANVREGMRVALATIGATLPGGFQIKKSKLRGVESFGMLCSAKELGLAESSDGIWELPQDAPIGQDLRQYLQLDDWVIDVDLTPNRADCLSVEGIARETAVINRMDWQPETIEPVVPGCDDKVSIDVDTTAAAACPRYLGRLVRGIDPKAQTPIWMQERLRRSGIRSLSPVVDITNYVLLELGQPLHAFDAQFLEGEIRVRMASAGEKLSLLNGQEIELVGNELIIADRSKPLALAGVMGGQESAVSDRTLDIFLECAFFTPQAIMGKARQHGLHTDSSHRFERGVDPNLQRRALEKVTHLILEIAGGTPGPVVETVSQSHLPKRNPVRLRAQRVEMLLGKGLPEKEIVGIFQRLGMEVKPLEPGEWQVTPPSFRFDISIEADLIEELARIEGYDRLPVRLPNLPALLQGVPEGRLRDTRVQDHLCDRGYREAITYSFVESQLQQKLFPDLEAISLANPLSSEMSVMRTSLWPGLLIAARRNINRQHERVRLFESGLCFFRKGGKIRQENRLAGIAIGPVYPEQWGEPVRALDFFDLKGDVESLLALTSRHQEIRYLPATHPALHPGQTARICQRGSDKTLGWLGMLHPSLANELDFDSNVFLFELDQEILSSCEIPRFRPISNQPLVRRDLAFVVPEAVPAQELLDLVAGTIGQQLVDLVLFDVYRGQGLNEGEKSLALGLVLQDRQRTLRDKEVDRIIEKVVEALEDRYGARLRG